VLINDQLLVSLAHTPWDKKWRMTTPKIKRTPTKWSHGIESPKKCPHAHTLSWCFEKTTLNFLNTCLFKNLAYKRWCKSYSKPLSPRQMQLPKVWDSFHDTLIVVVIPFPNVKRAWSEFPLWMRRLWHSSPSSLMVVPNLNHLSISLHELLLVTFLFVAFAMILT